MKLFASSLVCSHLLANLLKNNRKERNMTCTATLLSLCLLVSAGAVAGRALAAEANKMSQTIWRAGSQGSFNGPAEFFTGNVRVDRLFHANDSASFSGAYVTFESGARSAWHTHPTGQHLIVTAGVGRTQEWGGPIEEIKAGDVIWCPPKVKHWHGASPTTAMTHIALTGTINGKNVEWMEKVTDKQYNAQ
jgi:quercetin dioxygenase-like cupin family protein